MYPKEFELLVLEWLSLRLPRDFRAFHRKKYTGKTRQVYEIDISFEGDMGGLNFVTLVECKMYAPNRRVEAAEINEFGARLRDIGAHKGLLATTSGFQSGVYTLAEAERIALLLVRDASVQFALHRDEKAVTALQCTPLSPSSLLACTRVIANDECLSLSGLSGPSFLAALLEKMSTRF